MQMIVVVDDNRALLNELDSELSFYYEIVPIDSGNGLLQIVREAIPDMIILNLNLPDMDGLQIMDILHDNAEWKDIPVIILSDIMDVELETKCLQIGAADYIRKPFVTSVLLNRIRRCMESQRLRRQLEIQVLQKVLEIEEKKAEVELQKALAESAARDPLTGLLTRNAAMKRVNAILTSQKFGAFLMLDMDNFKAVNDTYGHQEGDRILVKFARTLEKSAGDMAILSRIGGDEFFVFITEKMTHRELQETAEYIVRSIEREIVSPGKLVRVTVSMGIAEAPMDGKSFDELYGNADKALYYVKNDGKNAYRFFGETQQEYHGRLISKRTLADIKDSMSEKIFTKGSYMVDYSSFEKIYRFMERTMEREKRSVRCVLITLTDSDKEIIDLEKMKNEMQNLEQAVTKSLRRGDVSACYSATQMLILLIDIDDLNAITVANRMIMRYHDLKEAADVEAAYEIQPVASENKEVKMLKA